MVVSVSLVPRPYTVTAHEEEGERKERRFRWGTPVGGWVSLGSWHWERVKVFVGRECLTLNIYTSYPLN